jgi:hypothetical protein
MDRDYIREQMLLMLMGEETDISEGEIRRIMSSDSELQAEYEEVLTLKETSEKRIPPPVSSSQWAEFMANLHNATDSWDERGILKRLAEFFLSPLRAALAVSSAAILIIGIMLFFQNKDITVIEDTVVEIPEGQYKSIEQIDESYQVAENLVPTYEEVSLVEDVFAAFTQGLESKASDPAEIDFEFDQLENYYFNDKEDIS